MNARNKLNVAYLNGCLLFSSIIGVATQSWPVFLTAFAALTAGGVACGDIRPRSRGR